MDSTAEQRSTFAAHLLRQIEGRRRAQFVAEVSAASGESFSESALGQTLNGLTEPTRAKVFAMEKVLGLPPGTLSCHLGYLPIEAVPSLTPEEALLRDTSIPRSVRLALVAGVEASRRS